jgi:protein-S-isoprenylcysteine O-methyltransferase Ste14
LPTDVFPAFSLLFVSDSTRHHFWQHSIVRRIQPRVNPFIFLAHSIEIHLSSLVRFLHYFALIIFFLDLPVPVYWFVLHPFTNFWRRNIRAAFWFAGLFSWTAGAVFVIVFRKQLIGENIPSQLIAIAALPLIAADFVLLFYSGKYLGAKKLVGHAELSGKSELTTTGLYKYVRHPRYTGMIAAIIGACMIAQTKFATIVGVVWLACVLLSISFEEREMRGRFGAAYEEYSRATPRFLPRF